MRKLIAQLIEMGFSDIEKAKQALKLNNMNPISAIDWLLANESSGKTSCKSHSTELPPNDRKLNELYMDRTELKATTVKTFYDRNEIYENVPKLMENFRQFKR